MGYWSIQENQRSFLETAAKTLGIERSSSWGKVTTLRIKELGGYGLLNRYEGSLLLALRSVYPGSFLLLLFPLILVEINWKQEWFRNVPKYKPNFWNSLENQREFLDNIAKTYHINSANEWKKISSSLICKKGGQVGVKNT